MFPQGCSLSILAAFSGGGLKKDSTFFSTQNTKPENSGLLVKEVVIIASTDRGSRSVRPDENHLVVEKTAAILEIDYTWQDPDVDVDGGSFWHLFSCTVETMVATDFAFFWPIFQSAANRCLPLAIFYLVQHKHCLLIFIMCTSMNIFKLIAYLSGGLDNEYPNQNNLWQWNTDPANLLVELGLPHQTWLKSQRKCWK